MLGALAAAILGLGLLQGMLLGSVTASTDAAAVFSILRSRGVVIVPRLRHLLELESGSNDPAAVFLTVGMIALIEGTIGGVVDLLGLFVVQMGLGLLVGWVLARGAVALINRLHLEYDGRYTFDAVIAGDEGHGLREVTIAEGAPAAGQSVVGLGLPAGALLVLLYRDGRIVVPQGGTVLEAGDRLLMLAEDEPYQAALDILAGTGGRHPQR